METNKRFNKFIKILGLIIIAILVILIYTVNTVMENEEFISFSKNNIIYILIFIAVFATMYLLFDKINDIKIKNKNKKILFTIAIIIYFVAQIFWINYRDAYPISDQFEVYNDAKLIAQGKINELVGNDYLQMYPHQSTLILFYSLIFKICGTENVKILQYINAIANTFTVIGLYLITKIISNKENSSNNFAAIFLGIAFIPLSMISTFVYGDMIGLAFSVFAVYYIIKYRIINKAQYIFISAIFMSLAYFCRMNTLIVFIAILIYLILDLIKFISSLKRSKAIALKNKCIKVSLKTLMIILFIFISIMPTNLSKNYMNMRLQLDTNEKFPTIGHIAHGISYEGYRGPGWYVDKYVYEWSRNGHNNKLLEDRVINFLNEYIHNPIKGFKFFRDKIASMWTEQTFGSVWYNTGFMDLDIENFSKEKVINYYKITIFLCNIYNLFISYDKIILIIIYTSVLLFLIRNKNITNEQTLLVLIFLGGFAFQLFWEGKSRYVLPYVVMLIPLASVGIKENIEWITNKFGKLKKNFNIKLKIDNNIEKKK